MAFICGRYLISFLLFLSVVQTAAGLWWRDLLFNNYLRPTIERLLSHRLDAEVRLAHLTLTASELKIANLRLEKPGQYRIAVSDAQVRFTLSGLWSRQLDAVHLQNPRVEIFAGSRPNNDSRIIFPERPPLEITHLSINNGFLSLPLAGSLRELHGLDIDLFGTRRPHFKANAHLGAEPGLPVGLTGEGSWEKRPGLILHQVEWDGASLLDTPLRFQLNSAGATVSGSARLPQLTRSDLDKIAAILNLPVNLPTDLDFSINTPELALSMHPAGFDVQLDIPKAVLRNRTGKLECEAFLLNARKKDSVWNLGGRFTLEQVIQSTFSARYAVPSLTGDFSCVVNDIGSLAGRFDPAQRTKLTGGGMLTGQLFNELNGIVFNANFTGRPSPEDQTKADYRFNVAPLRIRMAAHAAADKLTGRARILLNDRTLAQLSGDPEQIRLQLEPIGLSDIQQLTGPTTLPKDLRAMQGLSGTARFFQRDGHWHGEADLALAELKTEWVEASEMTTGIRMAQRPKGMELNDLSFGGRLVLPDQGGGRFSGDLSGRLVENIFNLNLHRLDLDAVEFFSKDGLKGLTGGRLHTQGALTVYPVERRFDFVLDSRLGADEMLLGPFYSRLDNRQALLRFEGHADLATQMLTARRLALEIPDLAQLELDGNATPKVVGFGGSLTIGNLGVAFTEYLQKPLESIAPELSELQLDGALSIGFGLRNSADNLRIRGTAHPQNIGVTLASAGLEIVGLNGLLPLSYQAEVLPEASAEQPQAGRLTFDSVKFGPATLENSPIRLLSFANRLAIPELPALLVADGKVRISQLNAAVDRRQPIISARIGAHDIDLKQLTEAFKWPIMSGTINADLGEIRYADGTLSSAGQAVIDAFGGSLIVSNISLNDPASRYRTLSGDIDFTGIDLYQLTHTLEFGEINGILDGHVHQLRLFGATPSHFEAELTTRETGRRNISVKALNNISILSQGGLSGTLSRGIYRFIDFYRYHKIGLRCTLNNDVFQLQGTALADSDEHLVDGGILPPKIDIIAPRHDVSFKEMLKRLSRIERTGH